MNSEVLEHILSCPSLPSLPAVALRVIELTANPNVSLVELANTIQNDQGLAAKVLRTVNSSFYGLRQRCGTINKALVMLGLGPVKALALGFSLVSCMDSDEDDGFDHMGYWRRGLYTAVAAKCFSEAAGKTFGDEAFLGGLLQDIGVMAMHRAMGNRYLDVMDQAKGDHRALVRYELSAFEVQHPDIGAMLAQRWRLPDELVLPVKYHERPTAAPLECADLVRVVGLGNYAHDALTDEEPMEALRKLYARAEQWFGLTSEQVDQTLKRIAVATKEMASLFRLNIGECADAETILVKAEKQLVDLSKNPPDLFAQAAQGVESLLINPTDLDPMTGVLGRSSFDSTVRKGFQLVKQTGEPMTLGQISVEGIRQFMQRPGGQASADEVIAAITALLKKHFEPFGGVICRLGTEIFAVVIIGTPMGGIAQAAEEFRRGVSRSAQLEDSRQSSPITVSIGLAGIPAGQSDKFDRPEQLVVAAVRALQQCRSAGGNCVRSQDTKIAA